MTGLSCHLPHGELIGLHRRRRRRIIEIAVILAIVGLLAVFLVRSTGVSLTIDHPIWLAISVGFEFGSMACFARVQRLALAAGGIRMTLWEALRITYASNAVSVTVPVGGSAAATANTIAEFRHDGADSGLVAWTLMTTGIISTLAFAVITAIGAVLSGNGAAAIVGVATTLFGMVPVALVLLSVRRPAFRARLAHVLGSVLRLSWRVIGRPKNPNQSAQRLVNQFSVHHFSRFAAIKVLYFATMNWLLDAACLGAVIAAFGQPVPWRFLFAIYATGVGAAAIGITPAGIGIVEVAIAAALTRTGMTSARAFPAALTYRAISCWLVMAIGWLFFTRSRRHRKNPHQHGIDSNA